MKFTFICIIWICFGFSLNAQGISYNDDNSISSSGYNTDESYTFKSINTEQGLPHYAAHHIMQDSFGFIWISTREGLCRYDGLSCNVFTANQDSSLKLEADLIWLSFQDSLGRYWFGTKGGGLSYYNLKTKTTKSFQHDSNNKFSISNDIVTAIYEDDAQNVWIGTDGGGLNKVIDKGNENFSFQPIEFSGIQSQQLSILDIVQDDEGKIWLATYGEGILIFEPKTGAVEVINSNTDPLRINDNHVMTLAREGSTVWIGTKYGGMSAINLSDSSVVHFQHDPSNATTLPHNFVWDIYVDRDHNKWIGTYGGGLAFLKKEENQFKSISESKDGKAFRDKYVLHITQDSQGHYWIATDNQGAFHFKTKPVFTPINIKWPGQDDTFNLIVNDYYQDTKGNGWLATNRGLYKTNNSTNEVFLVDDDFSTLIFYDVIEDENGVIWVATNYNLYYLTPGASAFKEIDIVEELNEPGTDRLFDIELSENGNLWLASDGGLIRYNPVNKHVKLFQHETDDESTLSSNKLSSILIDDEFIWVTTDNQGISIFDTISNEAERVDLAKFLAEEKVSDYTTNVRKDDSGNIWVGTAGKGLYRIHRNGSEIDSISHYSKENGLISDYIYDIISKNNQLLIASRHGLSVLDLTTSAFKHVTLPGELESFGVKNLYEFNEKFYFFSRDELYNFIPANIEEQLLPPKIQLTGLEVYNSPVLQDISIPLTQKLELNHDQDFISISYALLNYDHEANYTTSYVLEGHDPFWLKADESETINYTNLEPGKYIFKAKMDGENEPNSLLSLDIVIKPPFWQTTIFRFLILSILLAILFIAYKYRTYYLLKEEKTRNRIARDLHDDLSGTLSSISFFSEAAKRYQPSDKSFQYLQRIDSSAIEAKEKINDIIWAIDPSNDDWSMFLKKCKRFAADAFDSKEIEYEITVGDNFTAPKDLELRQNLWLIFKEMVNNLVRHSDADKAIINFHQKENTIFLSVEDDGIGFYTEDETERHGIKNIKHRADIIGAEYSLESSKGEGTIWKLQLAL